MQLFVRIAQALAVAFVFLLSSASAQAAKAVIEFSSYGTLRYTSEPGLANNVVITQSGPDYIINDSGAAIEVAWWSASQCSSLSQHKVRCTAAGINHIIATLDDYDDIFWTLVSIPTNVFGQGGNDTILTANAIDYLVGGPGNDVLKGFGGDDTLEGGPDNNSLYGGSGNDTLVGENGNDFMEPGPSTGTEYIICGLGVRDVVNYADATGPLSISLQLTNEQNTGGAGWDMIRGCEDLIGGAYPDELEGDAAGNQLYGNGGADILKGWGGPDWLSGGAGDDTLEGGSQSDYLFGDANNDTLIDNTDFTLDGQLDCGDGWDVLRADLLPYQTRVSCEDAQ